MTKSLFMCVVLGACLSTACSVPQQAVSNTGAANESVSIHEGGEAKAPNSPPPSGGMVILRANADGARTELRVGQEFGISLSEHPSVGYTSEIVGLPPQVRAVGRTSTVPRDVAPGGDSGTTTFRFAALSPGAVTVRVINRFRGDPIGEDTYHIVIR